MIKKITSILVLVAWSATIAKAQTFSALYTFDSVNTSSGLIDPTPVPVGTGVTFGDFSAVGTPSNPTATGRFSFTHWPNGAVNSVDSYSTLTGSIDVAQYYEVTITPDPGYLMDLTAVTFSVFRSGTGIRTYSVRSGADGFTANLPASIFPANTKLNVQTGDVFFWNQDATTTNQNGSTITLSGAEFTSVSSPITFRFYAWNAEGTSGTFSIDNVTISGSVTPAIIANFITSNICNGDSAYFIDASASGFGTINSWSWDFGDGVHSTSQDPIHYYDSAGTYPVSLYVTDNQSNANTFFHTVVVNPMPIVHFASSDTIGCGSLCVNFQDLTSIANGGLTNWFWDFGDMSPLDTTQNPSHCFTGDSVYSVSLAIISDSGCFSALTKYNSIAVNPMPVADFDFADLGGTVSFNDFSFISTGNIMEWLWNFGDGSSSVSQNPLHTYSTNDPVNACLIVNSSSGCTDTICKPIFSVGVKTISSEPAVSVYPNPSTNGMFTIDLGTNPEKTTVTVYSILGNIIITKELNAINKQVLDLSNEANGSYFITINNNHSTITRKITINK